MKIIKKTLKIVKHILPGFVIGFILTCTIGTVVASNLITNTVTYDNTDSGLESTTVQDALDELSAIADDC